MTPDPQGGGGAGETRMRERITREDLLAEGVPPMTRAEREWLLGCVNGFVTLNEVQVARLRAALAAADALVVAIDDAHELYDLGERAASAYDAGDVATRRQCEREASELRERLHDAVVAYRALVEPPK